MICSIDDLPIPNTSLIGIDITPQKKACLSFQTFPASVNSRGEQYDLIFTQITNFELEIEKIPCDLKSLRKLTDSPFLKKTKSKIAKVSARIPSSKLIHFSMAFDGGTFEVAAVDHCLLRIWSA